MIEIKDVLNALAFVFTLFLVFYGMAKGYDLVELTVYNLYFATISLSLFLNLVETKKRIGTIKLKRGSIKW